MSKKLLNTKQFIDKLVKLDFKSAQNNPISFDVESGVFEDLLQNFKINNVKYKHIKVKKGRK